MGGTSYSREGRILKLLTLTAVIVLCQGQNVTVVLDVYTPTSTLDNNTTLQLGTTCILICRTGGLPHGTDYNYTWTCPNGPCTIGQGRNTNRDTYGDRLLLNILSYSDAGTYTCQVRLATTDQLLGMDQFALRVEGGIVLHSGTNLIPNNDFITSVQDITSNTTITIQCTSHQQPHWRGPNGQTLSTIQNKTLHQILNGNTSILTIDTNNLNNFTNGRFSCNTTQHTANVNLYIGPGGLMGAPPISGMSDKETAHFIISPTLGTLAQANRFIVSYQRQDLNAPLDVEYQEVVVTGVNTEIVKEISIPGVVYIAMVWAVNGSQYSITPTPVMTALQLAQAPAEPRFLTVTTTFTKGLELNWIPPKQPNGPTQYQLNYGTNTTQFTTVDTAGGVTYYNLTGLQQNTTYYIRVVAVSYMTLNGVARTEGEWITATTESEGLNTTSNITMATPTSTATISTPTPTGSEPPTSSTNSIPLEAVGIAVGVAGGLLFIVIVILIAVVGYLICTRRRRTKKQSPPDYYSTVGPTDKPSLDEEKQSQKGPLVIANNGSEVAYSTILDVTDNNSSSSEQENKCDVITNKHAEEAANGLELKVYEYATTDEVMNKKSKSELQSEEYATIDERETDTSAKTEVGYATIPDQPNDAEYSVVGPLLGGSAEQKQPPDFYDTQKDTEPPSSDQSSSTTHNNNETMKDGRPLPNVGYETIGNGSLPADTGYDKVGNKSQNPDAGYETVDKNNTSSVAGYETIDKDNTPNNTGYEAIDKDGTPCGAGYETVGNGHPSPHAGHEEVKDKTSKPDPGYETVDVDPTPTGEGEYELVDAGRVLGEKTTNKQKQPPDYNTGSTDTKEEKPHQTGSDTALERGATPTATVEDLYTTPDMSKKKKKLKEDDLLQNAPSVPSFDPELLYSLPEKKKKDSDKKASNPEPTDNDKPPENEAGLQDTVED